MGTDDCGAEKAEKCIIAPAGLYPAGRYARSALEFRGESQEGVQLMGLRGRENALTALEAIIAPLSPACPETGELGLGPLWAVLRPASHLLLPTSIHCLLQVLSLM